MRKRWIALLTPLVMLAVIAFWTQRELESTPVSKPLLLPRASPTASAPVPVPDPEVLGPDGQAVVWGVDYPATPLPAEEAFKPRELADATGLDPLMPQALRTQLTEKIAALKCDSTRLTLHEREGTLARLIVSDCWRFRFEPTLDPPLRKDEEYHAMWVWDEQGLQEVPSLDPLFGFMYQSGSLMGVTDLNRNGDLELWLSGTKYECGEEDNPCDWEGRRVVEVRGRRLQVLDPLRLTTPAKTPQ